MVPAAKLLNIEQLHKQFRPLWPRQTAQLRADNRFDATGVTSCAESLPLRSHSRTACSVSNNAGLARVCSLRGIGKSMSTICRFCQGVLT